jgi:hypothetical protein
MEAESKELKELERMKAVKILHTYQDETWAWRDKKVKEKTIEVGDIVLLRSPHIEAYGKLEPKWIGPYLVTKKTRPRSFRLADTEGKMLPHSWNANNLVAF